MKILFAADEFPYSGVALKMAAGLAMNTWSDITLMGVVPSVANKPATQSSIAGALDRYRETFYELCSHEDSPFKLDRVLWEWIPMQDGAWEQIKVFRGVHKDFRILLRFGQPAMEILKEARNLQSDLIILGATSGDRCLWSEAADTPQKVVASAESSVLLVKEDMAVKRIVVCIDDVPIGQEALEMINQMIVIHGAGLVLIGLTKESGTKPAVYQRMIEVGDYYADRGIPVESRTAEISELEKLISQETREDMLTLSMGKKSVLGMLFSREWVERFVSACKSSVLVLR